MYETIFALLDPNNTGNFNRSLAHSIGINEAIVYQALIRKYKYFQSHSMLKNGKFYCTISDLAESTALSRYQQEAAINKLGKLGLLRKTQEGIPARRYFELNTDEELLSKLVLGGQKISDDFRKKREGEAVEPLQTHSLRKTDKQDCEFSANKNASFPQTSLLETDKQDCEFSTNKNASFPQTSLLETDKQDCQFSTNYINNYNKLTKETEKEQQQQQQPTSNHSNYSYKSYPQAPLEQKAVVVGGDLVALIDSLHLKSSGLKKQLSSDPEVVAVVSNLIAQHGLDRVIRQIRYTDNQIRAGKKIQFLTIWLQKACEGDWGKNNQNDHSVQRSKEDDEVEAVESMRQFRLDQLRRRYDRPDLSLAELEKMEAESKAEWAARQKAQAEAKAKAEAEAKAKAEAERPKPVFEEPPVVTDPSKLKPEFQEYYEKHCQNDKEA